MTQVIECLPSKPEALNSHSSTTNNNIKIIIIKDKVV
jgi:hypothetical protein